MLIDIIDVGSVSTHSAKNGRQYQSLEVTYKNEQGQAQSKKLMSFGSKDVFATAQQWSKGDKVNIATEKDDNGYWQWTRVLADGEVATVAPAKSGGGSATRVAGSNYPTQEERAQTQVYIIRQSSLTNAVTTLATTGKAVSSEDVLALARVYEGHVLGVTQEPKVDSIEDLSSDIPF
jgi:hypothetical protein